MKKSKPTVRKRTMPAKTTRSTKPTSRAKKSSPKFRSTSSDARLQRWAFVLVFAVVGAVFAFYSFAATATTSFSGSLSRKNPIRSHSITTTASGTFSATGTASTKGKNAGSAPLTLQLKTTNGTLIAQATGNPATLSAPVGVGTYTIDVSSTASSANYTVNVSYPVADPAPPPDATPPTAPTNLTATAVSTSQVNLAWQSATDNVGVASYDVLRNGIKISTTMTTTYNDVNLSPATTYSYTVKARDAAGNLSAASNSATATTQSATDTTAPNVSIASPANGATVSGTTTVTGSASDNVGVSKVEVQIGSNGYVPASFNTGTVNGTYTYSLNTTLFIDGTHTLTVRATDTSGNQKTSAITLTIKNNTAPPPSTTAPETQGTWVSPEGLTIEVNSLGNDPATGKLWTIAGVYRYAKNEATAAGDFAKVAPSLKIKIQDSGGASAMTTAVGTPEAGYKVSTSIYMKGVNSTFSIKPDRQMAHEYGHAWSMYHFYITQRGNWTPYFSTRWTTADGSVRLGQDPRLDSTYGWSRGEIIADDYRLLLGSATNISQSPNHMNSDIPEPSEQPGLRDWFLNVYAKQQ